MTDSNSSDSSSEPDKIPRFKSRFDYQVDASSISAMITNRNATQLIVGGGGKLHFYEFYGMTRECRPYLHVEWRDQIIKDLEYSPNFKEFLAVSNCPYTRLYASNGDLLEEFVQGDPYIRDLKQTRGHVSSITSCTFHPIETKQFLTSSVDGTIRIWSVEQQRKSLECIRFSTGMSSKAHGRVAVNSMCLLDNFIVGAGNDNNIKLWDFKNHTVVAMQYNCKFPIINVVPNPDTQHLLVQANDQILILDKRQLSEPVLALENIYNKCKAGWSPDGQEIICAQASEDSSAINSFDLYDGSIINTYPVSYKPSIVWWNGKLDQILIGGDCGKLEFLFDKDATERKGILFPFNAPIKKATIETNNLAEAPGAIYLPNALPAYQTDPTALLRSKRTTKRELTRLRRTDVTAMVEKPVDGAGQKGKIGTSSREAIMARVLEKIPPLVHHADPRDAIEKYKGQDPIFIEPAYNKSNPSNVLHNKTAEEEEDEKPKRKKIKKTKET